MASPLMSFENISKSISLFQNNSKNISRFSYRNCLSKIGSFFLDESSTAKRSLTTFNGLSFEPS